jgi:hypothetical protein
MTLRLAHGLLLLGFCLSTDVQSQSNGPFSKERPYQANELSLSGWNIIDSVRLDLDHDLLPDLALVLERSDSMVIIDDEFGTEDQMFARPRCLAVFTARPAASTFGILDQNDRFVPLLYNDIRPDPFKGIEANGDSLTLHCLDWRSIGSWWMTSWSYFFVLREHRLELVKVETGSIHRASHEGEDYNFDIAHGTYTLHKNAELSADGKGEITQGQLPSRKTATLGTMPKQGTWEILPGVFL